MDKKELIKFLNRDAMPFALYAENVDNIGKAALMYVDNKEVQTSKNTFKKTLSYQKSVPNDSGEYETIDIIVQKKVLKNAIVHQVIDVAIY